MDQEGHHILSAFDKALREIKETTLQMGVNACESLDTVMSAIESGDRSLASQVIAADDDQDQLEVDVDRMGMEIMLRFQPFASDLKLVISSMKIAKNLERISDQAVSIAKKSRKIAKNEPIDERLELRPLYDQVSSMLDRAMRAYEQGDEALALEVSEEQKTVKKVHKTISKIFSRELKEECSNYRDYLDFVFICRWFERVGSLSINIAEDCLSDDAGAGEED